MTAVIEKLRVRQAVVPLARPLKVSSGAVEAAPFALVDVTISGGAEGRCCLFTYTPLALRAVAALIEDFGATLIGAPAAPLDVEAGLMGKLRLLGREGLATMAVAGLDMALWDARARAAGLPLCRLLGAEPRPIRAYNSNGLGLGGAAAVAAEGPELLAGGFEAMKLRLGYPTLAEDVAVFRALRDAVGPDVAIMVDYNQGLSVGEARRRATAIAEFDPVWLEEPVRHDDPEGSARVRSGSSVPIQLGENWWGPRDMAASLAAGAGDLAMPDAMKIGGVTGWMRAAALAEAADAPVSSHLFPEVSVHLLCATPTADWLEYVDWAAPILQDPPTPLNGALAPNETPGTGIDWDETAIARYAV